MKMNKKITAAVTAAMVAMSVFSVSAAGIGVVHTNTLLQAHPRMEKAQLTMKEAAQKAKESFQKESAGKTDAQKQQLANNLQRELAQKERDTMTPIINDVMKAIQEVRKEQNLDVVLESGAVVDGGTDITSAVAAKLTK